MRRGIGAGCMLLLLLAEMLSGSGCGKGTTETVPELKESIAANSAYRPVESGEIGKTEVLFGTVVPTDYCSFYHTNVNISEIAVEIGDYVEAGDVVAYADVDAAKETLEGLNDDLENENQNYAINRQMAQIREHQITADAEASDEVKSNWMAAEKENQRYDQLLHEYRAGKLNASIQEQQEIIEQGTLRAEHSGYVTYTKNIEEISAAEAYENIVVVADPDTPYIELADTTIAQYKYADYEVKYLQLNGEHYDVEEISYSMDEVILARVDSRYPNVRLACPKEAELTMGATYPVFFRKKKIEGVLIIGADSLYGDENESYVYVKNETGGREKRTVTTGASDDNYVEALSGLEEGELVYYSSDARVPVDYEEYTVELTDYNIDNKSMSYSLEDKRIFWYDSEYEGTIAEIAVDREDEVKEGDLLYVIDSGEGKAALTEAGNNISQENTIYAETIKGIEESLAAAADEDTRQLLNCQRELEAVNHAYRLKKLQKAYDRIGTNNDGNGKISVYAAKSGTVIKISAKEGEYVTGSQHVMSVGEKAKKKLLVQMKPIEKERVYVDNIADFGETVTITVGEKAYTGHCTGWTANQANNLNKTWVSSDEDGAYLSHCTDSGYFYAAFYMEMEEEQFYEDMLIGKAVFSYLTMEDVIAIPSSLVYQETRITKPEQTYYYVWRVVDGELVKQYVLIDEENSGGSKTVVLSGLSQQDVLAKEK